MIEHCGFPPERKEKSQGWGTRVCSCGTRLCCRYELRDSAAAIQIGTGAGWSARCRGTYARGMRKVHLDAMNVEDA
jgi:hypothetical protein